MEEKFDKYKYVSEIITEQEARLCAGAFLIAEDQGKLQEDKQQVEGSTIAHGHELADALMLKCLPRMEEETGLSLIPTYAFFRIYRKGMDLKKHTDRPSCEVSVTINLSYVDVDIWPIYADGAQICLMTGDGLIYRGCDVEHWRDPLPSGCCVQIFLHYVDANGPHAEHALDKRKDKIPLYQAVGAHVIHADS